MKQKKKPFLLITIGSLIVLAIVFANMTGFDLAKFKVAKDMQDKREAMMEDMKEKQERLEGNREQSNPTEQAMKDQIKQNAGPQTLSMNKDGQSAGIPDEPIILLPKFERYDPVQNDSVVNALWYREESSTNQTGEKVRQDQGRDN